MAAAMATPARCRTDHTLRSDLGFGCLVYCQVSTQAAERSLTEQLGMEPLAVGELHHCLVAKKSLPVFWIVYWVVPLQVHALALSASSKGFSCEAKDGNAQDRMGKKERARASAMLKLHSLPGLQELLDVYLVPLGGAGLPDLMLQEDEEAWKEPMP